MQAIFSSVKDQLPGTAPAIRNHQNQSKMMSAAERCNEAKQRQGPLCESRTAKTGARVNSNRGLEESCQKSVPLPSFKQQTFESEFSRLESCVAMLQGTTRYLALAGNLGVGAFLRRDDLLVLESVVLEAVACCCFNLQMQRRPPLEAPGELAQYSSDIDLELKALIELVTVSRIIESQSAPEASAAQRESADQFHTFQKVRRAVGALLEHKCAHILHVCENAEKEAHFRIHTRRPEMEATCSPSVEYTYCMHVLQLSARFLMDSTKVGPTIAHRDSQFSCIFSTAETRLALRVGECWDALRFNPKVSGVAAKALTDPDLEHHTEFQHFIHAICLVDEICLMCGASISEGRKEAACRSCPRLGVLFSQLAVAIAGTANEASQQDTLSALDYLQALPQFWFVLETAERAQSSLARSCQLVRGSAGVLLTINGTAETHTTAESQASTLARSNIQIQDAADCIAHFIELGRSVPACHAAEHRQCTVNFFCALLQTAAMRSSPAKNVCPLLSACMQWVTWVAGIVESAGDTLSTSVSSSQARKVRNCIQQVLANLQTHAFKDEVSVNCSTQVVRLLEDSLYMFGSSAKPSVKGRCFAAPEVTAVQQVLIEPTQTNHQAASQIWTQLVGTTPGECLASHFACLLWLVQTSAEGQEARMLELARDAGVTTIIAKQGLHDFQLATICGLAPSLPIMLARTGDAKELQVGADTFWEHISQDGMQRTLCVCSPQVKAILLTSAAATGEGATCKAVHAFRLAVWTEALCSPHSCVAEMVSDDPQIQRSELGMAVRASRSLQLCPSRITAAMYDMGPAQWLEVLAVALLVLHCPEAQGAITGAASLQTRHTQLQWDLIFRSSQHARLERYLLLQLAVTQKLQVAATSFILDRLASMFLSTLCATDIHVMLEILCKVLDPPTCKRARAGSVQLPAEGLLQTAILLDRLTACSDDLKCSCAACAFRLNRLSSRVMQATRLG